MMNRPDDEPVTDTDAEAALRALYVPSLVWRVGAMPRLSQTSTTDVALVAGGVYLVTLYRRKRIFWQPASQWYKAGKMRHPKGDCDVGPQKYQTMAEAKAACEYHYTTGTWE